MGVSLEAWRVRIGTFLQRPRLSKSLAVLCIGRKVVAGLLRLTLLLSLCLCVSAEPVDGEELKFNVSTHSPTWHQELRCDSDLMGRQPTGTRVCIILTTDTRYPTTTLDSRNNTGDDSSMIGQKEYAMIRRLLMLSGDVEPNPGPKQQQAAEATRPRFSTPISGSPWCVARSPTRDGEVFFYNEAEQCVLERPPELEGRADVDDLTQNVLVSQTLEMIASSVPMTEGLQSLFDTCDLHQLALQQPMPHSTQGPQSVDTEKPSTSQQMPVVGEPGNQDPRQAKDHGELLKQAPGEGGKRGASEDDGQQPKKKRAATGMSEEDKHLLNSRLPQLIGNIAIEDGMLLAHLRSRGELTKQKEEIIKSKGDRSNQVSCLLDVLLKRDSNTIDNLIYSLRATGQSHIVDTWLRHPRQPDDLEDNDTGSLGATSLLSDTNLLEGRRPRIMRDLDLANGSLLAELRSRKIITKEEEGYIKGMPGNANAVGHLIDIVLSRSPNSLEEFLHALNRQGYSNVVDYLRLPTTQDKTLSEKGDELPKMKLHPDGPTVGSLKRNMGDRLGEWNTALEEGVSDQKELTLLPYIQQPCKLETKAQKQQTVLDTITVVENSRPGDRLVIYGEAGMGKTTLLKQLARSWIEGENKKLVEKFTYVFLIPLRRVGQGSLLNIICDELKLVPVSSLEDLKKSLELCEHGVLYLLDSYEELQGDVIKAKRTDIDDLIAGRLYPKSTVVVTSRPGSKLKKLEDQTTAQCHLQDLPENKVKPIVQHHFGGNKDAVDKVQRSFPAMAYLQKPINLALFIFIITQNKHLTLSYTQAELFSLVLQYIMLAFAKKKKLEEFKPKAGSYITNKGIPRDIRRLFRDIAKKSYEQRKENNVTLHIEDADDQPEYLDFGLFTAGPDTNTVLLPHRLFIEYFAAAHLAENPDVWKALFEDIKQKSESESPRLPLPDVVRSMGLENVLRFVIALSPQPQLGQVCRQLGSLFVLERQKIVLCDNEECDNYRLINFDYYSELIRDCGDESGKRLLASALLDAPVTDATDGDWEEDRSHVLFPYLDDKQRVSFLKNIHNIDLTVIDGKTTLSCTGGNERLWIGNRFVVALVYCHDCIIAADVLYIRGELGRELDLPASVFTRMSGVRQLKLYCCTLCQGLPDYMSDIDISAASLHSLPCPTNSSLERVELEWVKGLEHCDVITSRQCQLVMEWCYDVRVSTLKTCFPRVSELELHAETTAVYETAEELTSWLSTIPTVRGLGLAPQHEGESVSLCHLLNILAEKELEYLGLWRYTLLFDVSDTSATVKQNNTLSELWLRDCKGDLGQLLEVCSRQCPQLEKVQVWNSNLVFDGEKVESVKQLSGLQEFELQNSAIHTPAGRRLSEQEAEQLLNRLCPSAGIYVSWYPEPESASGSGTKD